MIFKIDTLYVKTYGLDLSSIQWKIYIFACIYQKMRKNENKSTRIQWKEVAKEHNKLKERKKLLTKAEISDYLKSQRNQKLFNKIKIIKKDTIQ